MHMLMYRFVRSWFSCVAFQNFLRVSFTDDDFEDVGVKSGNRGIFFVTRYDHLLVGRRI